MVKKNMYVTPKAAETSQFPGCPEGGEMTLWVSGMDFAHRQQPWKEFLKGWSHVLLTPDSSESYAVPRINSVC